MHATELAGEIADSVNSGINVGNFAEAVEAEHNYLQAQMFRQVVKPTILALAGTAGVDARNEREVKACRKIADEMGWEY